MDSFANFEINFLFWNKLDVHMISLQIISISSAVHMGLRNLFQGQHEEMKQVRHQKQWEETERPFGGRGNIPARTLALHLDRMSS